MGYSLVLIHEWMGHIGGMGFGEQEKSGEHAVSNRDDFVIFLRFHRSAWEKGDTDSKHAG